MAYEGIEEVKKIYQEELVSHNMDDKALRIRHKDFQEPIFEGYEVHPEEEPDVADMNNSFMDIGVDLYALDLELTHAAEQYEALMNTVNQSLSAVDEVIAIEQERIEDMNMINGNYKDFSAVRTLTASDFNGNASYLDDERTFTTYASDREEKRITVVDVQGNGYEGNDYVYKDKAFLSTVMPTKERKYMTDGDTSTAYEYSRITMDREAVIPPDGNLDTEEAKCSITLRSDELFNTIRLSSDIDTTIIEDIEVSDDGAEYKSVLDNEVTVNRKENMYNYCDYIYGSGILCFPETQILRIRMRSNGTTSDSLAYQQLKYSEKKKDNTYVTTELQTAKRHVIRVNNIKAMNGTFSRKSTIMTENLITSPVESIAIFASEYVPSFFPEEDEDYVQYSLVVNGEEHEVVPINSNRAGTKILRHANYLTSDEYAEHISEPVRSAYLKITMKSPTEKCSPYLSNIKVCFGKAATK